MVAHFPTPKRKEGIIVAKKRKPPKRRPRHGRLGLVLKVISSLVAVAGIGVAAVIFFRVEYVEVTGNVRYTQEEVVEASGVQLEENLFLVDKPTIEREILAQMAYVEQVHITRQLPSTLLIEVEEITTTVMLSQADATWRISLGGKLVERIDNVMPEMPYVSGATLLAPSVGTLMTFGEEDYELTLRESLLTLLGALNELEMLEQVEYIDLSDSDLLDIEYAGRFTVRIPYGADYMYKLRMLQVVVEQLESNEMGTIDLTMDGKAHFIPVS